jgi:pimeloyl-ACP methyl ester carboxylesterase
VVLLHGYGLAQFSMAPWALRLAQEGWRCVLVDLRGHGKSTGKRIYFGIQETHDLSQLLDATGADGRLKEPVAAFGESYGAVLALRWKPVEPRVRTVVAITPYAGLSNTVLNLRHEYARWLPKTLVKAGLKKLPPFWGSTAGELDTTTVTGPASGDRAFCGRGGGQNHTGQRRGTIARTGGARKRTDCGA